MAKPTVADRLGHMLEAIAQFETQLAGLNEASLAADRFRRLGIERCLEIISEAARHSPGDAKARHPAIPWRRAADIGSRIRHSYPAIDSGIVWAIVTGELATLKAALLSMQASGTSYAAVP